MKYEDIHPAFRNCLGYFEAFRKLGFRSEDIFVFLLRGSAYVMLRTQGKEFVCAAGPMDLPKERFTSEWEKVAIALNYREIPDGDFLRIYTECEAYTDSVGFMVALSAKGIQAPVSAKKQAAIAGSPFN
jgi:hypothetical protein